MSEFTVIGQMVTEARHLLDSIKGGALRTMQTQFNDKLKQWNLELNRIKEKAEINAKGPYVTKITVKGDRDTFYPVFFTLPERGETDIHILRHADWNSEGDTPPSDFKNHQLLPDVNIHLRGSYRGYLRTIANLQRNREAVSNIGYLGYIEREQLSTKKKTQGYLYNNASGFMLRGGSLSYEIICNHPILFDLKKEGEMMAKSPLFKWTAKTLPLKKTNPGDKENNVGFNYIGYNKSKR